MKQKKSETKKGSIFLWLGLCCLLMAGIHSSCGSSENEIKPYDPSKPVVLTEFFPTEGKMAEKIILEGSNFGINPDEVKVYFNEKRAAVISAQSDKLYVLAPRQPGDDCKIAVVIGSDSITYDKNFKYITSIVITTIASKPNTLGDDDYIYEGTLAEVSYGWLDYLCVDSESNLFVNQSWPPRIIFLNEEQNRSTVAYGPHPVTWWQSFSQPTADDEGKVVYFPDEGNDWAGPNCENYYSFDPATQWSAMVRQILHPSAEDISGGAKDFHITNKDAFAYCALDGAIWTRVRQSGQLVRLNLKTRKGETIENGLMPGSESKMVFHPEKKNLLYLVYSNRNCIFTYDILTGEHKLFAGKQGVAGWRDGEIADAEFNKPEQMDFDAEMNIYIADANNHVIRKISTDGYVSTVAGMPGSSGYLDGSPEEALLNSPHGIAINAEGDIYIGDNGNKCVRKLSIQ